jgi:hypothetical protein
LWLGDDQCVARCTMVIALSSGRLVARRWSARFSRCTLVIAPQLWLSCSSAMVGAFRAAPW